MRRRAVPLAVVLLTVAPAAAAPPTIEAAGGSLTVEIAWSERVDLDLFVTGPDGETVYFGNRRARDGIRMGAEAGCGEVSAEAPPFVETAVIPGAAAGRYRLSVDYIRDCGSKRVLTVPFTARLLDAGGRERGRTEASVGYRVLETIGWEFDLR
ncbi:MAG: hypothetical protein H3C38_09115 [Rhodospirillales bacterium]|nr:hypothetical protein [Rhodospirillales bacterium]